MNELYKLFYYNDSDFHPLSFSPGAWSVKNLDISDMWQVNQDIAWWIKTIYFHNNSWFWQNYLHILRLLQKQTWCKKGARCQWKSSLKKKFRKESSFLFKNKKKKGVYFYLQHLTTETHFMIFIFTHLE